MAARFTYLTSRDDNRLARQQARIACAAALLRWIHVVITGQVWRQADRRRMSALAAQHRPSATFRARLPVASESPRRPSQPGDLWRSRN
jgi:predicted kinase